jgi:F-type H+-transporting ATPase subunit b
VDLLAVASGVAHGAVRLAADAGTEPLFQINLFQVLIAATNFVVFLAIIWTFAFKPIQRMLADRKTRIEEGLRDAEQARRDRESAEADRLAAIQEARREANDILARAQKVADESRQRDLAATRDELERIRVRASADLESEKLRAIGELRAEVADLALRAAGRVVGETMNDDRQRRLVDEFLRESTSSTPSDRSA